MSIVFGFTKAGKLLIRNKTKQLKKIQGNKYISPDKGAYALQCVLITIANFEVWHNKNYSDNEKHYSVFTLIQVSHDPDSVKMT